MSMRNGATSSRPAVPRRWTAAEAVRPVLRSSARQARRRDVLDVAKAGFAGQRQHLLRREEADERRPAGARALLGHLQSGTHLGFDELERQQERHRQRGARRERGDLAKRGRNRVPGEVHADAGGGHDRRLAGIEAGGRQLLVTRRRPPRNRPARAAADSGIPKPSSSRRCRFQAWAPGWSTSNTRDARRSPAGAARRYREPAPRMTYWSTPRAACSTTRSSMNEHGPRWTLGTTGCPADPCPAGGASPRPGPPAAGRSRRRARAAADRPGRAGRATRRPHRRAVGSDA